MAAQIYKITTIINL